ncbi:Hypothetical protein R9X50_00685900 [Acrodontium crateriforme]|uniref:Uncharacterized protein n=1 Tax=Acrodontium crateriforme TaxID=150365 RepID=A0AAQ3RBU0_9PEZI|nr:Hypothetical protein R9X50_00685900 [Acrodontium crateriforme]
MASAESNKQAASSLAGEKDVQNIIAQGKRALEYATNRQEIPADFVKAMEKIINRSFPLPQTAATNAAKSDLSTVGLALCNASITFSPILTALDTNKQIAQTNIRTQAALLRVYGFFLRDASRPRSGREKSPQNKMNIFEEAVRTVWRCFASDNLALAQTVLERCAVYVDQDDTTTPIMRLAPTSGTSPLPVIQKNKLQYNLLRIAAGSRQENDACEDFFYSKLDQHVLTRCPELAKQAATVFYEVANRHYRIQNWKTSKTWSERAIDALNVRDSLVPSSFFDQKLRIRITRLLVLTMLSFDDEKQRLLASSLVTSLDHECGVGNCMLILKLRFEVCVARKPVDLDEFQGLLDQVTVATNVSDHTFVMYFCSLKLEE